MLYKEEQFTTECVVIRVAFSEEGAEMKRGAG